MPRAATMSNVASLETVHRRTRVGHGSVCSFCNVASYHIGSHSCNHKHTNPINTWHIPIRSTETVVQPPSSREAPTNPLWLSFTGFGNGWGCGDTAATDFGAGAQLHTRIFPRHHAMSLLIRPSCCLRPGPGLARVCSGMAREDTMQPYRRMCSSPECCRVRSE